MYFDLYDYTCVALTALVGYLYLCGHATRPRQHVAFALIAFHCAVIGTLAAKCLFEGPLCQ